MATDHSITEHHGELDYDRQDPQSLLITILGVIGAILLYAVIVGLEFYYNRVSENIINTKVYTTTPTQLRDLRAREDESLTRYRYVDEAKGIVQIPIDRAIEVLLKEGDKPMPAVPVAVAEAGTTAVGSSTAQPAPQKPASEVPASK